VAVKRVSYQSMMKRPSGILFLLIHNHWR
jgi:hypothetical protein